MQGWNNYGYREVWYLGAKWTVNDPRRYGKFSEVAPGYAGYFVPYPTPDEEKLLYAFSEYSHHHMQFENNAVADLDPNWPAQYE